MNALKIHVMYLMIMKFLVDSTMTITPWYNGYNGRDRGRGLESWGKTVSGQCNIMRKFTVIKTHFFYFHAQIHVCINVTVSLVRWEAGEGEREGRR